MLAEWGNLYPTRKFFAGLSELKTFAGNMINSLLPFNKNLDSSKSKASVDANLNVAQMIELGFDRVENIVGKGENAGYQHFLLFPHNVFKRSTLKPVNIW